MNYKIYYTKISLIDENEKEVAKITFPEISPNVYDIQKTFVCEFDIKNQSIKHKNPFGILEEQTEGFLGRKE